MKATILLTLSAFLKATLCINTIRINQHNITAYYATFVKTVGAQLVSDLLDTTPVSGELPCQIKCLKHDQCQSFNVGTDVLPPTGGLLCELLATNKYVNGSLVVQKQGWGHFTAQSEGCEKKPCIGEALCAPDYVNSTFACQCPPHFFGKYCQFGPSHLITGGSASQSENEMVMFGEPELALDGDTNNDWELPPGCSYTGRKSLGMIFWKVDMGERMLVDYIDVIAYKGGKFHMAAPYVGNNEDITLNAPCIPKKAPGTGTSLGVCKGEELVGRYVGFFKYVVDSSAKGIRLCEVLIYGMKYDNVCRTYLSMR